MSREIPIFFSTDDNYIPYLDVALHSLIANASNDYNYRIIVLNTGLSPDNIAKVKQSALFNYFYNKGGVKEVPGSEIKAYFAEK